MMYSGMHLWNLYKYIIIENVCLTCAHNYRGFQKKVPILRLKKKHMSAHDHDDNATFERQVQKTVNLCANYCELHPTHSKKEAAL